MSHDAIQTCSCNVALDKPEDKIGVPDQVSKVRLNKAALKEFDLRDAQYTSSARIIQQHLQRRPMTRQFLTNIKRFARRGGPDTRYLIGFARRCESNHNAMGRQIVRSRTSKVMTLQSSSNRVIKTSERMTGTPSATLGSKSVGTIGPAHPNYGRTLLQAGMFPATYCFADGMPAKPPINWEHIRERLSRRRASLSPESFSQSDFLSFRHRSNNAGMEKFVVSQMIPQLLGKASIHRDTAGEVSFKDLEPIGGRNFKPACPDLYDGIDSILINEHVQRKLHKQIVPSENGSSPYLPNFFLEVKAPHGDARKAEYQARYVGALGARAMQYLQSYGNDLPANLVYDNKAYTITATFVAGLLKVHTCHVEKVDTSSQPRYILKDLGLWAVDGSAESFRAGATVLRNARDWAAEQRAETVNLANSQAKADHTINEDLEED